MAKTQSHRWQVRQIENIKQARLWVGWLTHHGSNRLGGMAMHQTGCAWEAQNHTDGKNKITQVAGEAETHQTG